MQAAFQVEGNPDKAMTDLFKTERTNRYAKVDRDDPRSRLHFVKYMKRDGKTIKIWECGICESFLYSICCD